MSVIDPLHTGHGITRAAQQVISKLGASPQRCKARTSATFFRVHPEGHKAGRTESVSVLEQLALVFVGVGVVTLVATLNGSRHEAVERHAAA
jgi:phage terminase large subunit-like protein